MGYSIALLSFIALSLLLHSHVDSFNLEDRLPFVKIGPPGSFFGLSVELHTSVADVNNRLAADNKILVGAPTDDTDNKPVGTVRPGALYTCDTSGVDCTYVTLEDNRVSVADNISDQWLGVSVKSQKPGGKVAVCAHRYTLRAGSKQEGILWEAVLGKCYILDKELRPTDFSNAKPCMGKNLIDGKYEMRSHGYCQAGSSVAFADNEEEDLVMGLPGSLTWTGSLYYTPLKADDLSVFLSDDYIISDVDELHVNQESVKANSYLGFSLATGVLYDDTQSMNFVAGAPRANDTGIVGIFAKEKGGEYNTDIIVMKEILHGETLASAFGYDVKVVDVTGDGRQDLIIGAPRFFDRKKKHGGAVYIYINKGTNEIGPEPTTTLYGDIDSSFGSSIASIGDINMDGANDIAIGAPGAEGGNGSVYIYHGNSDPNQGLYSEPTQVLSGSKLDETLKMNGFGYSLSGGLDMDMNGYPDLAIGSLSDTVVMYRSRPIVNVQASVDASVNSVSIEENKNVEFSVTLCMRYTSTPDLFDEEIDVVYMITLDSTRRSEKLQSRLAFEDNQFKKEGVLTLFSQSLKQLKCDTFDVFVKPENTFLDKLSPFDIRVEFNVMEKDVDTEPENAGVVSLNSFPILNKNIVNTTETQVKISNPCGDDEICTSNLKSKVTIVEKLDKLDGAWSPLPQSDSGKPMLLMGADKYFGVQFDVTNADPGEDAHQARLVVTLPATVHFARYITLSPKVSTAFCGATIDQDTQVTICIFVNFPKM